MSVADSRSSGEAGGVKESAAGFFFGVGIDGGAGFGFGCFSFCMCVDQSANFYTDGGLDTFAFIQGIGGEPEFDGNFEESRG